MVAFDRIARFEGNSHAKSLALVLRMVGKLGHYPKNGSNSRFLNINIKKLAIAGSPQEIYPLRGFPSCLAAASARVYE